MIELSRADARRVAVCAQLLAAPRPASLDDVIDHLGGIQVDLTPYLAPSHELVLWSRLGSHVTREDVADAIESGRLVEVRGILRPAADVSLFTAELDHWDQVRPAGWHPSSQSWFEDNHAAAEQVLDQLRADGPLPAQAMDADFARAWRSSGWNRSKNVPMMLERLAERGLVAVSHREGRERVWDLRERVYPDEPPVPVEEAARLRAERRLASLGIARPRGPACEVEPFDAGQAGVPASVEGVRGTWRVDAGLLEELRDHSFRGRTALLSPLDRLVFDRKRMAELFQFDYALEMYKPAEVRQWGYWALPVLHGDRLVGKVDAEADRREGLLLVRAVHRDPDDAGADWPPALVDDVDAELRSLASFLGLEPVLP